jgi:hypothetical protein
MTPALVEIGYRKSQGLPWHKEGQDIDGITQAVAATRKIGMDYEVNFAKGQDTLPDGTVIESPVHNLYSNYGNEWHFLNTVRKPEKYEIIQNIDIAQMLDESNDQYPALTEILKLDTLGMLSETKRVFWSMEGNGRSIEVNGKPDEYKSYTFIYNDFAQGSVYVGQARVRIVCLNTAIAALVQSEEEGTLWHISHRKSPKARLAFRLELERAIQDADNDYFNRLESMVGRMWNEQEKDQFVNMIFPDPKDTKNMKQAAKANANMREAIVAPVMELAADDKKSLDVRRDRAEDNRKGLKERIEFYVDEFQGDSLYAGYNGATDWAGYSYERGTYQDIGESIISPTGERYKTLQRVEDAARTILYPNWKKPNRKRSQFEFMS